MIIAPIAQEFKNREGCPAVPKSLAMLELNRKCASQNQILHVQIFGAQ